MGIEEALVYELETIAGLSGKVYPGFSPGQAAPYIVYLSSEGVFDKELSGYLDSKGAPITLNIVANKYSEVKVITKAVIRKLIDFEGRSIGVNGPFIDELTYEQPVELYEDLPKLYRCVIDTTVYLKESE